MPIIKPEARAVCQDCKEEIAGSITISVASWAFPTRLGSAEGNLPRLCAEHHDQKRIWGKENSPQHSYFSVFEGSKLIGELRAVSMAREQRIFIEDEETMREFANEIRRIQKERGYY